MQKAIYNQNDRSAFYVIGGATNLLDYAGLLKFKIVNNTYFPLTTETELGYRYFSQFNNVFTFIGKYNKIIGTLNDDATVDEIDLMLKKTMASFYDIQVLKEKENVLLTDQTMEIDLKNYFYALDYSKFEYLVRSSSNSYIVNPVISGSKLILNRTSVEGFTNLSVIAKVPGKEVFVQTDFQVINPTDLYEDFELNNLRESDLTWVSSGDAEWYISDEESYMKSKSLRSGQLLPAQKSSVGIQLDLKEPGTLIFAYKTSTRPYFDRFKFYYDGVDMSADESPNYWSGENDWRIMSFSVRAGIRTFQWAYEKGPYPPFNRDIVWVDMIVLPDKLNIIDTQSPGNLKKEVFYAFPNPFNPVTEITFELLQSEKAELMVFDLKGRLVADVYRGELEKGVHSFNFDGSSLSSGLYFSVLKYGDKVLTNKLILAK